MSAWQVLLHFLGVEPRSPSTAYNWWSGAGSDIGEVAIFGGLVQMYRAHECHDEGCHRLGNKITVEENGHHYRRCSKHHRVRHQGAQP